MNDGLARFRDADRGASEVAGAALLIGLVGTAALVTLTLGVAAIDDVQSQTDERQASTILQELDSRFSSLSSSADAPRTSFDLGDTNPRDFNLRGDGFVNVTVNKNMTCSTNITMSSVRYENSNDVLVGYEAGGVWQRYPSGGSVMVTSPSIGYRSGTIDVNVVELTGSIDQSDNDAVFDVATSRAQSFAASNRVFSNQCARPDNVTLSVRSRFYRAWAGYLESEFDVTPTVFDGNDTARVFLPQSSLPSRVDDSRNNVINLTDPPAGTVSITTNSVEVDKGAGNVYSVSVTPLNSAGLNIGNVSNIENATNVTRPPLDVVFVMDESGSMGFDDGDSTTRAEEAQDAAQGFLGELNETMDRAGVVTFENVGEYYLTNGGDGRYISGDFTAVNQTLETIGANGGTESQYGIEYANNVFELRSNETRNKVMVMLTDGMNDDCQDPGDDTDNNDPFDCGSGNTDNVLSAARADDAAANGVTIYTVGYGDDADIDQAFLREIADRTGGEYHQATNSNELDEVFDDIVEEIARTKTISLTPVSSNYTSANGQVYAPQAAGSMDQIARVSINGNEFANINDPTADSEFSHSFAISDGESVSIEAYDFECNEWVGTGRTRTNGGNIYNVVRCSDVDRDGTLDPTAIYTDGDFVDHLLDEDEAWWQDDINETFNSYDDVRVNRTAGPDYGKLDLESNQALVYWDLTDGPNSENRLLMLYEVGLSESEAVTSGVINIEISRIDIEN